jgi:RecQ family ATP-dependent DNA helicase
VAAELEYILEVLGEHPDGMERPELLLALRERWPNLLPEQLERYFVSAGEAITEVDGRLSAAPMAHSQDAAAEVAGRSEPRRFVAIDLESVVKPIVDEPYREQHVFQIGAARFGPNADWVAERRQFNDFMELPSEEHAQLIHRDQIRGRYLERKRPASDALERLRRFCRDADVLVAFNGISHDFPLVEREYERAGLPPLFEMRRRTGPRLVDGLYLALTLWPIPPRQHALKQLLDRLELDLEELVWHDALDDAKMLIELLEHAARKVLPGWDPELLSLIASAAQGSDAWALLLALSEATVERRAFEGHQVTRTLSRALAQHEPLRPAQEVGAADGPAPPPLSLPTDMLGETGEVDIDRLVRAVKGERAEARASQRQMVARMRESLTPGRKVLIEAPTGVGKSYAVLAVALDWLAAHPENRVVISTYTKQLQGQLAEDIERLNDAAIPGLVSVADMVKGSRNRLSLRGAIITLSEFTQPEPRTRRGRRTRAQFGDDARFQDLVIYLTLRLLAEGRPTEEWEARSVDRVDVPAFFDEYCPRRLGLYLATLSQADAGDYPSGRGEISRHTAYVDEALRARRLIIANHSLLLAHLGEFEELGERTLLIVDEAHELENAATAALGPSVESGLLDKLVGDTRDWLGDQPGDERLAELERAARDFDRLLDDERLHRAALQAFDTAEADPLGRATLRTITVASPLQGDAHVEQMEHLARELRDAYRQLRRLNAALLRVPEPDDLFERDRLAALRDQARELVEGLARIVGDIDAVLGAAGSAANGVLENGTGGVATTEAGRASENAGPAPAIRDNSEQLVLVGPDELPELPPGESPEIPETSRPDDSDAFSNHVVWAEEIEELRPGPARDYRFRLTSSPITLGREPEWRGFLATFPRSYYVSATLRVAEAWDFIRERLALNESIELLALPSPFDPCSQAELICFEDFPSWAEHGEAAMRTIAYQLSGYAQEVIRREEVSGAWENGALVLTTSRAAAAGVFDWLARLRVRSGQTYPLISAGLEGNQRAVETFKREGGIVSGTRGLWQGVDVDDARRLRLVWINKLPFASFTDPVIAARRELVRQRAEAEGAEDPDAVANEDYYLPLAALALRQAVGRLIRSQEHRGVVVISDRKLAGPTRLRRLYRRVFLGSLDQGFLKADPDTGEPTGGNVVTMREGWRRIFSFLSEVGIVTPERAAELSHHQALFEFTELPETRAILQEGLSREQERDLRQQGAYAFAEELVGRCQRIAAQLQGGRADLVLKEKQVNAIAALAHDQDLLAILPTGYGKSYVFQLPALALAGVTIVVSPLVSLMTDQALELNRTIGGRVRALVAPMRESNSRTGKSEVEEELRGTRSHGIKLIYLSPERLCQRQFQDWIRAGVERGIVRQIAIDEAHTFVQWGDDFRPNLRRAEQFLRQLKTDHGDLRLMALTGTANETVRQGLRRALFGLEPGEAREDFAFVRANPLRRELAIYRRSLPQRQGGPLSIAGLVERAVEHIDGHAILYCLTVRQVDQLHAHLTDHLQGHPIEVLRYHGRLSDAEKTAVANRFRAAPAKEEDGYRRLVVVATSAFGLGIDRRDIRAVFCVSPPTDLAALYQQLGRAGRDRAAQPSEPGPYTAGLAAMYPRARRTIAFMTRRQIREDLLLRMAAALLAADSPLSTASLAEDLIDEDLRGGRLSQDDAADPATADAYQAAMVRVLAELAARGIIDDLGDFPVRIALRRGDCEAPPEMEELIDAILAEVGTDRLVELGPLYERLRRRFDEEFSDPGALWSALLELHTLGYLDVSQWPNRGQLTAVSFNSREVPEDLAAALSRRQGEIEREVALLDEWFASTDCANEDLGRYFAAEELPEGTCGDADCRCSNCWSRAEAEAREPDLLSVFMTEDLRPASATGRGRRRDQQRLDRLVRNLLWNNPRGLGERLIFAVLRGDDHYYNTSDRRRKQLWPRLLLSRVRGSKPGLRPEELRQSLVRLQGLGEIVRQGGFWRLGEHVERERERPAAEAADQAGAPVSP